jgi:hypothetical protein
MLTQQKNKYEKVLSHFGVFFLQNAKAQFALGWCYHQHKAFSAHMFVVFFACM